MKEITVKEVTVKELVAAFEGKHVNILPMDQDGITINMRKATLELEDDKPELWLVSRDSEDRVTASICIDEDSIESIEEYEDGTYVIHFSVCIASIDISECKTGEEELIPIGDLESQEEDIIQVCKDEGIEEMYIDETSNDSTIVEENGLIEVSEIKFVRED